MASQSEQLELLKAQLRSATKTTENAAIAIQEHVNEIETAYRDLARSVDAMELLSDQAGQIEMAFEARVQEFTLNSAEANLLEGRRRERMTEELQQLERECRTISRIASETRILALNANIQASATSGAAGRAFRVVADNVKELAKQSDVAAKTIGDRVERISRELEQGSAEAGEQQLRLKTIEDRQRELRKKKIEIWKVLESAQAAVASQGEQASGLVCRILEAMQFQDIVRQKIEHVTETIDRMSHEQGLALDVEEFASGYHMHEQRETHEEVTGSSVSDDGEGPAIELF